jgi:hypothetical protein
METAVPEPTTAAPPAPRLDEDGLLRVGRDWVAIPDAQLPVVALLVDRYNRLVRTDDLTAAYVSGGHSGSEESIRSLLSRLGKRISCLGLRLRTVRGRGVVLTDVHDTR